jgi:hypothetical protein
LYVFSFGEEKRDGNTEITEERTQSAQRKKDKENAETRRTPRFAEGRETQEHSPFVPQGKPFEAQGKPFEAQGKQE